MSTGPFKVVQNAAATDKKQRPKQVAGQPQGIRNISGLETHEYDLDSYDASVGGDVTVLPRHSLQGGIEGSANPYGQFIKGNIFTGEHQDRTPMDRAMPTVKPRAGIDVKNEVVSPAPAAKELPKIANAQEYVPPAPAPAPAATPQQEAAEEMAYLQSLVGITEETISTPPVRAQQAPALPVAIPQELLSFERKHIRVRISGSQFGNYRGHYLHIVDEPNFLILFYDIDAAGFEPPITDRDTPITISCEDKDHKVYYMGMDFDLKMNKLGMQVFIKQTEHKEQ